MLEITGLNVSIARTPVLRDVSLNVPQGAMVGLIGRNGAGKTTLMRSVMGLLPVDGGSIMLEGEEATTRGGHERVGHGIGYMPEDRKLVPDLLVEENVLVPAWSSQMAGYEERLKWVYGLMPEVEGFASRRALSLSGGQQKLVALARALLVGQKLLLLDEPFEGVAPALSQRLIEVIATLKSEGLSVLISESDYTHTAGLVDHSYLIERGSVTEKKVAA